MAIMCPVDPAHAVRQHARAVRGIKKTTQHSGHLFIFDYCLCYCVVTQGRVARIIWYVIIAFGLIAGVILIAAGYYLFGVIIGGLAVLRLAYALTVPKRRDRMRYVPVSDSERALLRSMARDELLVAADEMGISGLQLRRDFNRGLSVAEMATEVGVTEDAIVDAIVNDASSRIAYMVAKGEVTHAEGEAAKSKLRPWAEHLITIHKRDLPRRRR